MRKVGREAFGDVQRSGTRREEPDIDATEMADRKYQGLAGDF